ncbi:hypothetical protein TRFO_21972 [Tritrichomonas foetus]|uniref:Uncharacterized protein n=1 Tax=Tritrichomonas foetus TaxID=1144522 RepID=A0A1J4KHC0_9EUKA|nr:hypothetical protein TRFO_21972 [Tritrichomonas foetus]|eukprot:OHT09228.1 hypothetical protein TRFO_21972 [Tritrichomonas foetus]
MLGISIIVQQVGQSVVGTIDAADKSFVDEENVKYALSEWDQTEIDNKPIPPPRKRKAQDADSKKKKKHHKDKDKEKKTEKASQPAEKKPSSEKKKEKTHKVKDETKSQKAEDSTEKVEKGKEKVVETQKVENNSENSDENGVPDIGEIPEVDIAAESSSSKRSSDEEEPPVEQKPEKSQEKPAKKEKTSKTDNTEKSGKPEKIEAKEKIETKEKISKEEKPKEQDKVEKVEEEKPKEDEEVKADKKPKTAEIDIEQLIKAVLARSWTNTTEKPIFLDLRKKVPLPAAVFPIFSVFQHTKLFISTSVEKKKFTEAVDTFFNEYEKAPLCDNVTTENRFVTTLVLLLLINQEGHDLGFAPDRVQVFTEQMISYLNYYAKQIVSPLLINFEVLCNRFATARFEVDPLLDDFKQVLSGIRGSLNYTNGINGYLMKQFMTMLDTKMLNKILNNPSRFVFSKAITWNSFLTAFQGVERLELPLLRQAVWALVMAVNMTSEDEPCDEVRENLCPTLDSKIIVYLLKNYKPDEMMPTQIDWKRVATAVGIDDVNGFEPVKAEEIPEFESAGQKLKINNWNHVKIEERLMKLYPYLSKYSV